MLTTPDLQEKYEEQNRQLTLSERDSFTRERYEQFFRYLPTGAVTVLDIGCSTGRGGERLKELNGSLQIFGLDAVPERLDQLPPAYTGGIYGLSNSIPREDRSFDVVLAGEFLEHLYPSDVDSTLAEFQRVLKIGGRLLLTTPNPRYVRNRLRGASVYGVSHLSQHYPELLRTRLMMHGFSRVRVRGSGKMSRYLGYHFPLLRVYGSYLISADKY